MVSVRQFIRTMAYYRIGAIEAQQLLNAPVGERTVLSTGQVIEPYQSI